MGANDWLILRRVCGENRYRRANRGGDQPGLQILDAGKIPRGARCACRREADGALSPGGFAIVVVGRASHSYSVIPASASDTRSLATRGRALARNDSEGARVARTRREWQVTVVSSTGVYMVAIRRNGTLYVGVTNDLGECLYIPTRSTIHATLDVGILVWYEVHEDINVAIAREKQIKGWNRAWKPRLIEARIPAGMIWRAGCESALSSPAEQRRWTRLARDDKLLKTGPEGCGLAESNQARAVKPPIRRVWRWH